MAITHTLLFKGTDAALDAGPVIDLLADGVASIRRWRALAAPVTYAYIELGAPRDIGDDERNRYQAMVGAAPRVSLQRLERCQELAGASAGIEAPNHYVVETDVAPEWWEELVRWYDTEHMPGLAAVPGCVRAQRHVNHDGGPRSFASYDLMTPHVLQSSPWLAVRHTPWSDRVRPQFRATQRTMFGRV